MPAPGHHLAIYNFGLHTVSYSSASVQGFALREPLNFAAAARAVGFVARSGYVGEPGPVSWGEQVFPRFLRPGQAGAVSSLSLWHDIECLMAFTYSGVHADALKHARHWNVKQGWPPLVLFWVPAGEVPSWSDAVLRFERLVDQGPTWHAFDFKSAFTPEGAAYSIDRERVKALVAENGQHQADLLAVVRSLPV